ncbi:hypothetical protein ES705_47021 [subsurface metagenome]
MTITFPALKSAYIEFKSSFEEDPLNSADELCDLIEEFFKTTGKVAIAQYIAVGFPNSAFNQTLFYLFRPGANQFVGTWVSIIRECCKVFKSQTQKEGSSNIIPELVEYNTGSPKNYDHPVNRLIHFRNSFFHGGMVAF